ncbi:MAG: CDP-alcohol phosphatidyltransferase family protein [Nocardioidaceae bacterium]
MRAVQAVSVVAAVHAVVLGLLLVRAMRRRGQRRLGPADAVTLARALLVGVVLGLVVASLVDAGVSRWPLVTIAAVALALDAVDGWVARRTHTVSDLGARFDMEVDAFLILVLSVHVAASMGAWVLALGLWRYAYVIASWGLPWLRLGLPARYWRKIVAATVGIVLVVAASQLLPALAARGVLLVALALLSESFGRDIWWQWRHRAEADSVRSRRRRPRAVVTALAVLVLWVALLLPDRVHQIRPAAFAGIPAEGLVLVLLALVLPRRLRTPVAAAAGLLIGLVTVLKLLDAGFFEALDRPLNPVTDWHYADSALSLLSDSIGHQPAVVVAVVLSLVGLALLAVVPLASVRVAHASARHQRRTTWALGVLTCLWVTGAATGLDVVPSLPVASARSAEVAFRTASQVPSQIHDERVFARAALDDPLRDPPPGLLRHLRGKDVVVVFVESYGRAAVQDTWFSTRIAGLLDDGTARLRRSGFLARSSWLTSPTFGGVSWLAHSTFQSGLWVDNQQRYDTLLAGDRTTLSVAFGREGWHTVGFIPSNDQDWPQRSFYHWDEFFDSRNVGYEGPRFSYARMADQYALSFFQRRVLAPEHRRPVMAEIDLATSHNPWTPIPTLVDWSAVGDGSVFDPMPAQGPAPSEVWPDPTRVQQAYADSIAYDWSMLVSFLETYGDDDLVLVVLGDHQPWSIVSGEDAGHDVPVSIISKDPRVMDRVGGWGWQPGLRPAADAPVARMDTFRDRFLTTFSAAPR